jgi:hypothetical protein
VVKTRPLKSGKIPLQRFHLPLLLKTSLKKNFQGTILWVELSVYIIVKAFLMARF